jgi:hypothetical protein
LMLNYLNFNFIKSIPLTLTKIAGIEQSCIINLLFLKKII